LGVPGERHHSDSESGCRHVSQILGVVPTERQS